MNQLPSRIVLASNNAGKVNEIREILAQSAIEVLPQSEFNIASVAETGTTFVENAIIKARHAATVSGLAAIADDSGIEIDYLDGRPGVYSARYAGEDASDADNNHQLLSELGGVESSLRGAHYRCVMVYLRSARDPMPLIAMGSWSGRILEAPVGEGGFGYDPLFFDEQLNCSAAQCDAQTKNRVSHRAKALADLMRQLTKENHECTT